MLNLDLDGLAAMTDPERDALRRPADGRRDARARPRRGRRAGAAGCASTSAWRRASARRTGCSRRATAASARGTDLVVGFVEAHGRPHTVGAARRPRGRAAPADRVPRRRRRGDGHRRRSSRAARRSPSIDELAHTNVPGLARATKRWEDVEVIRDAGIHVVSTLNVQHLESVADAVATITGAPVNERLPDEVLLTRRRDRARRHEPARAAPADEARQRLPARARPRSRSRSSSPRRT